ncbi:hypothetical protein B0G75_115165 [Paraburkholderia sp. BL18I3N2]|nr:hypothetical protein B0G75_115165 [Paraburkholderia sp. BL18I3N2]
MKPDATLPLGHDLSTSELGAELRCFPLKVSSAPGLFVRGLQFPFAVGINVEDGEVALRSQSRSRRKTSGDRLWVPLGEAFDILLLKSNLDCASAVTFRLSEPESADCKYASLRNKCAVEVFTNPGTSWNVPSMARRLGLPPAQLCQRLFAEGAALSEIIRKQRCMNAFLSLLATVDSMDTIARNNGFTGPRQMEREFHETLMLDAQLLERPLPEDCRSVSYSVRAELRARVFRIRA